MAEITPKQVELLRHTLGADKAAKGVAYRNHFYTGSKGCDYPEIAAMVEAGLMIKGRRGMQCPETDYHYFHATEAGMKAVGISKVSG